MPFLIYSCATDESSKNIAVMSTNEPRRFPEIKNANAVLECVSTRRTFFSDEDIQLTFKLRNLSENRLLIYEWMRKQEDNIRLYYFLSENPDGAPPISEWKVLAPEIKVPAKRQSIELSSWNSTLVDKIFKLEEIGLDPNSMFGPKILLVVGELNLKSIKLRSEIVNIEIKKR